jgi:hypothetical protein
MPAVSRTVAVVALGALVASGCGRGDRSRRSVDSSQSRPTIRPIAGTLIRRTIAGDSSEAAAFADSLGREGWDATVGPRVASATEWPVNVVVPGDSVLARAVLHAFRQSGLQLELVGAQTSSAGIAVSVVGVNRGTHGMSARVRWLLSPDRHALLAVEDPRGVENDPVPNGFVFAREGVALVQHDSTWDVATSPDWRLVAYSRAYTIRAGETDSVVPSEWRRLARSVGLKEPVVRRNAFPTSGMVSAFGAARTFVVDVSEANDSVPAREVPFSIAEGWRLAWTPDGARVAIGAPSEIIGDDAQASRWRLVDPQSGDSRGVADVTKLVRPQWVEGPNIDVATEVDMKQPRAFRAGQVDVESQDGWIRMYVRDGARLRAPRIIGPGVALTMTTNGEFVLAIAPDPNAKSYDPPNHLVVYHTLRQ